MYHDEIQLDGDTIAPPSMTIDAHRFRILGEHGGLFSTMKQAVEMIGEKLEDPILEEAIVTTGLRQHIASMQPEPGGSILNRELNAQFLIPTVELRPFTPPTYWGRLEEYTGDGPFVSMGTQHVRVDISVYDFPKMVSYTMSNTALQHTINQSGVSRLRGETIVDQRLALMEACQPERIEV